MYEYKTMRYVIKIRKNVKRDTLTFGLLNYRSVAKFRDYFWLHIQ